MQREVLNNVTVLFTLALGLALLLERFLEVVKGGIDLLDSHYDGYLLWTKRAEQARTVLERRLRVFRYLTPERLRLVLNRMYDVLVHAPDAAPGPIPTISGDLVRAAAFRIGAKVVGIAIGIWLAVWLQIDLIKLWPSVDAGQLNVSEGMGRILTGVAIGLGPGPLHKIITTIERRRADREAGNTA